MFGKYNHVKRSNKSIQWAYFSRIALILLVFSTPSWSSDHNSAEGHHTLLEDGLSDLYSEGLRSWLLSHDEKDELSILITMKSFPKKKPILKPSILISLIDDNNVTYLEKDGVEVSEHEAEDEAKRENNEIDKAHHDNELNHDNKLSQLLSKIEWPLDKLTQFNGSVIKLLTKNEITQLVLAEDLLESIEIYAEPYTVPLSSLKSAFQSIGLEKWGHRWASPTTGRGVVIYQQEAKGECAQDPMRLKPYYEDISPKNIGSLHAEQVLSVLHYTAENAQIYCGYDAVSLMPDVPLYGPAANLNYGLGQPGTTVVKNQAPPLVKYDLINFSWARVSPITGMSTAEYTAEDKRVDDILYERQVSAVIVGAGNANEIGPLVSSPAHAYNAISVGHYDHQYKGKQWDWAKRGLRGDNQLEEALAANMNPLTGAEKPEIIAPGVNLCIPTSGSHNTASSGPCMGGFVYSGSSFAAPIVTGVIANLLERYPWMKGQPTRVKSMLLAGAAQKAAYIPLNATSLRLATAAEITSGLAVYIGSTAYVRVPLNRLSRPATAAEMGAGAVDFHPTTFNAYTFLFNGFVNNGVVGNDLFETYFLGRSDLRRGLLSTPHGRYIEVDMIRRPLIKGVTYRVAMSWLVQGRDLITANDSNVSTTIDYDFDMELIEPNGVSLGISTEHSSAYELKEFVANSSGVLTVRIYNKKKKKPDMTQKQQVSVTLTPVYPHYN